MTRALKASLLPEGHHDNNSKSSSDNELEGNLDYGAEI
jgi:hypothetical protein